MLDHTDPVASIIPAMSLDSPSDNAMTALSRLALGPVNTAYYMAVFERFDNTGRTTTTWNWAACLATLNWMLFRQLWTPALVYLAAAEGLALIVYGIGRTFLQWPPGVELGVLGAFAMLAFAVPGLYGNAILYADIRKRVARALAASRTLPEACVLLEKQASSRKRLQGLVLANLVLVAAAALAYLVWAPSGTQPLALEPAVTVAQATATAASRPSPAASAPTPTPAATPAPVPVSAEATPTPAAPSTAASAPAAAAAVAPPALAASAPVTPSTTQPAAPVTKAPKAPAQASTQALPSEPNAPAQPAASAAPSVSKTPTSAPAAATPKPAAKATPPAEPASRAASTPKAKTAKAPASAAAPAASAALPTVGTAAGYYINVGLFADEANARKAQARLLNEGLPAFRQELNNTKGRRIRVRVGPYDSRAQADAAAESIRAMALEAVVFKQ
ncbi:sporulation protein [Acidovorax sp. Root275]|uniref:SPOR domain-containing protein n=1 Tax=unclassified Acidovorax TaxID=2684926 RepID=UPI00070F1735|nr:MULTISPECIES: SPOR domain-containing protein [unclassified Acidovorax]KRD27457.1 sporulation protein [Acidovorax sp. Root267]KRD47938.1 sporulation protein [Acidovorax sp. Root275]